MIAIFSTMHAVLVFEIWAAHCIVRELYFVTEVISKEDRKPTLPNLELTEGNN